MTLRVTCELMDSGHFGDVRYWNVILYYLYVMLDVARPITSGITWAALINLQQEQ